MGGFISYNKYKKILVLNETYESYVELKKLAKEVQDKLYYDKERPDRSTFKKVDKSARKLKEEYENKIIGIKDLVNINNYTTLKDFLELNTRIVFLKNDDAGAAGEYTSQKELLQKESTRTHKLIKNFSNLNFGNLKGGIISIYEHIFPMKIILHELQHAYDDYRSKGKYSNKKQKKKLLSKEQYKLMASDEFANDPIVKHIQDNVPDILNVKSIKDMNELLDELDINYLLRTKNSESLNINDETVKDYKHKVELICKYWIQTRINMRNYFKSNNEQSAYFVGTISGIDFFDSNGNIRNINDVWKEFIKDYGYQAHYTPKIKKILARKFSQYYHKIKEAGTKKIQR